MEPAQVVAENVRRVRVARGLSLSDLARRAGVAKATLVGLESGRGNPTVSTLAALAAELGVAVTALLRDPAAPTVHVARAGQGSVIAGAGTDVRFVHRTPVGGAMLELYELRVHGHQASAPHPAGALELYEWLGFSRRRILEIATEDSAAGLGLGDVTGRLEAGLAADVLVVEGDPLASLAALRNPLLVLAQGRPA